MTYVLIQYWNNRKEQNFEVLGVFLNKVDGLDELEKEVIKTAELNANVVVNTNQIEHWEQYLQPNGEIISQMTYGDGYEAYVYVLVKAPISGKVLPRDQWIKSPFNENDWIQVNSPEYKDLLNDFPDLKVEKVYSRGEPEEEEIYYVRDSSVGQWVAVSSPEYKKLSRDIKNGVKYTFQEVPTVPLWIRDPSDPEKWVQVGTPTYRELYKKYSGMLGGEYTRLEVYREMFSR